MTMITPSYLGETIEYSSLHACRSTLEDPTFLASRKSDSQSERYQIDYVVGSRSWNFKLAKGSLLPKDTNLRHCTAIGFTAKGQERWTEQSGLLNLECVGISPYPESVFPRVVGIVQPPARQQKDFPEIVYVTGDVRQPRAQGKCIIAHVVNDKTPNWGAAFGRTVREAWPIAQEEFQRWVRDEPKVLKLGNIFHTQINPTLSIFQLICQRGYGPSEIPRIRYLALKQCLQELTSFALDQKASIHMPRIGAGEAGGSWALISQLIDETLCVAGLHVTVYDLPGTKVAKRQQDLFRA